MLPIVYNPLYSVFLCPHKFRFNTKIPSIKLSFCAFQHKSYSSTHMEKVYRLNNFHMQSDGNEKKKIYSRKKFLFHIRNVRVWFIICLPAIIKIGTKIQHSTKDIFIVSWGMKFMRINWYVGSSLFSLFRSNVIHCPRSKRVLVGKSTLKKSYYK